MDALIHPAQLSAWQRFLQARRLHRETTRSKNSDWYSNALELECQLHLFLEGEDISKAHICFGKEDRKNWVQVSTPSLQASEEELGEYISEIRGEFSGKPRSLAVILHLADEFAISELARANERPEDLRALSDQLTKAPQEILEDHSISTEELSFRFFPYPGAKPGQLFGSAITISRKCQDYLRQIRTIGETINFPIRTCALSAPLVALAALPQLADQLPSQPFSILFSYASFSVIAFFTAEGNLVMLRSVRHHAGGAPPHVGRIMQTMAAALELPEPLVYILSLSYEETDSDLPELPGAVTLNWRESAWFDPEVPLEFQGPSSLLIAGQAEGLAASETFRGMAEQKWAIQDFLPATMEETELCPSQTEMKILRYGSVVLRVGVVALVLFLTWTGIRAVRIINDEAWNQTDEVSREGNKVLASEIRRYEQWSSLLADRSKAWVSMELVNQLFPDPESVILSEATHRVRPEVVNEKDKKAGVIKEWIISGVSNSEALNHLTVISSTKGMGKVFEIVRKHTGNDSLRMDLSSRTLQVNLLTSENKRFKPDGGTKPEERFAHNFRLTIKQRITAEDPIAIPIVSIP
ncbi:MAG: hypothetical protein GY872_03900 [Roseibacillus sp.]|mgnify:FL=1|nr:hypothetical protein [Roseibacillus sp.]|tara:strand:- start:5661 stop:7409 length:1749 start_codon:yes stop_codon:yes gene_type:complete